MIEREDIPTGYPDDFEKKFKTMMWDPCYRFQNCSPSYRVCPSSETHYHYDTMSFDDLKKIPISDWMDDNSIMFMWSPESLLPEAIDLMNHHGYEYKTSITWLKLTQDGKVHCGGMGHITRTATESLLVGKKGKIKTLSHSTENVILAPKSTIHSKKPDQQYDLIERIAPGPYLELFARPGKEGWLSVGNEARDIKINFPTSD